DHRDASTAGFEQETRGRRGRFRVLHRDVVNGPAEDPLAEDDHGVVDAEQIRILLPHAEGAEDQTVGELPTRARQHGDLAIPIPAGLLDLHRQAMPLGALDDRFGELGEVTQAEFGNHEADDSAPAGAEAACGEVGLVVELVDRALHPSTALRAHTLVVVDHVRDRLDGDAGEFRDVVQGYRHLRLPRSSSLMHATQADDDHDRIGITFFDAGYNVVHLAGPPTRRTSVEACGNIGGWST